MTKNYGEKKKSFIYHISSEQGHSDQIVRHAWIVFSSFFLFSSHRIEDAGGSTSFAFFDGSCERNTYIETESMLVC